MVTPTAHSEEAHRPAAPDKQPTEAGDAPLAVLPEAEPCPGRDTGEASAPADLVELARQFTELTRLLDEIVGVGKGLPQSDVDAMLSPVFGVLKGVMNRIIGAPAATLAELGIKAQVVMWGNLDWWAADAKLGWPEMAVKAFVEQTIAAAGLEPPRHPKCQTELPAGR